MNNLYKTLNNNKLPNQFNNVQDMIKQFKQFRQSFNGNPQQQVQELLNSGRMSQDQFNYLKNIADQFQNLLK